MKRRKEYVVPSKEKNINSALIEILNKALPVEASIAKLGNPHYDSNYGVKFGDITFEAVENNGEKAGLYFEWKKIRVSAYLPITRKTTRASINKSKNFHEFCLTDIRRKYYKIKERLDKEIEQLEKEEEKRKILQEKINEIKELSGLKTSKYLSSYASLNGEQFHISISPIPVKLVCLIVPKIEKMIQECYDSLNDAE